MSSTPCWPWPPDREAVVAGVMSGTSCDGVDVAVCRIVGSGAGVELELLAFETTPYEVDLAEPLRFYSNPIRATSGDAAELDFRLGELMGQAVLRATAGRRLDLVASHGHTIAHFPEGGDSLGARCTRQVGNPAVIAETTGVPVVSDFRSRDIAAGGQGAPLIPYADWCLLRDRSGGDRVIANLGGITNVTFLPGGDEPGSLERVLGFDSGPGNIVLNAMAYTHDTALRYDPDGKLASQGKVNEHLLGILLNDEYYERPPPKSAGRELFGEDLANRMLELRFTRKPRDMLATFVELIARTLTDAIRRFLPPVSSVYLCGGGTHNRTLVRRIETMLSVPVATTDDLGIPVDAKEAVGFALLGSETMRGVPSNVPSVTGAKGPRVLGSVTFP